MFHVGLALALGITGGLLFHYLYLPLPWLLGALWATLVASIARMPPAFEFVISNSTAMRPERATLIRVIAVAGNIDSRVRICRFHCCADALPTRVFTQPGS